MPRVPERKTKRAYGNLYSGGPAKEVQPSQAPSQVEKLAAGIYERQVKRVNKIAILDAANKMAAYDRELLRDPTSGALYQLGKDAIEGFEESVNERQKRSDEIMNGLSNNTQREAFTASSAATGTAFRRELDVHQAKQTLLYENEVYQTSYKRIMQDVADNYKNQERLDQLRHEAHSELKEYGSTTGKGQDWTELTERNTFSDMHKEVIAQLTLDGDPAGALAYAAEHDDEIFDDKELQKKLQTNADDGEGSQVSQDGYETVLPEDPLDTINPGEYKKYIDEHIDKTKEPKKHKAAVADMKERLIIQEQNANHLKSKRAESLNEMFNEGDTLREVRKTMEYQSMNPSDRKLFDEYWAKSKQAQASGTHIPPTAAQTQAAHILSGDIDHMLKMEEGELYALAPHLGTKLAMELVDQKRILGEFDPDVVRMVKKEYDSIMLGYGFNTGKPYQTDQEKLDNLELWGQVMAAIIREQTIKKRGLNKGEIKETIKKEVSEKVNIDISYWGGRIGYTPKEKSYFTMTGSDFENLIVPNNFNTVIYNRLVTDLRRPPTEDEVREEYLRMLDAAQHERMGGKVKVPTNAK